MSRHVRSSSEKLLKFDSGKASQQRMPGEEELTALLKRSEGGCQSCGHTGAMSAEIDNGTADAQATDR